LNGWFNVVGIVEIGSKIDLLI